MLILNHSTARQGVDGYAVTDMVYLKINTGTRHFKVPTTA